MNFQMFKLDLEKAEEPEIKLPTSAGSLKKQVSSRKTSTLALWITPNPSCRSQQTLENPLRDGEYQTTLPASWEIGAGQDATVRTWHGTTDCFKIGNWVRQGCVVSPCLFNLHAECIMRNAGLKEAQAGIKIAGRNINNLRYADDTTLWKKVKKN